MHVNLYMSVPLIKNSDTQNVKNKEEKNSYLKQKI